MLWHSVIMETFDERFNKKPQDKYEKNLLTSFPVYHYAKIWYTKKYVTREYGEILVVTQMCSK